MRDRAAIRVDVWRVVGDAEIAEHGEGLRGERFVELDDVHLRQSQTGARQDLRVAGTGPMPITRGATPATAPPT